MTDGVPRKEMIERLVLQERELAEQAAISIVLAMGFTLLRHFIDDGRLGVQFVTCLPAMLIASILLRPAFTIATAFISVATVQWLLIGKQWFDPLDFEHVAVASMFILSIVIVITIGRALRESLRRAHALAGQLSVLNHILHERVRDNIGMLHAIVSTAPADEGGTSLRNDLTRRIGGLASASEILRIDDDALQQLPGGLDRILAPFDRKGNIWLSGPSLQLDRSSAIALAMVVNRLASESAQSGALSDPEGSLKVTWWDGGNGSLKVSWIERAPTTSEFCHEERLRMTGLAALDEARFSTTDDVIRCDFEVGLAPDSASRAVAATK